jgi:aromatic ring-opening dioxygenase LigB subunit
VGRPGAAVLPRALTVGSWLLDACGVTAPRTLYAVAEQASPQECADLGAALARSAPRVALLAMGDGTACLSERAPGYVDPRAAGYDDAVAAALASADGEALLALDPALARELRVAGRAAWQVAAGAAGTAPGRCEGRLLARQAPYGVSYLVAEWSFPPVRRDA